MRRFAFPAALVLAALIAVYPTQSVDAARAGLFIWANAVAPSLFPFLAITPMLTTQRATRLYRRLFGKIMRPLLNCPGEAAGAVVISFFAGSPAGTGAVYRLAQAGLLTGGEMTRLCLLTTSLSPMFVLGAVAVGMLGDASLGGKMLASLTAAPLLCAIALKNTWADAETPAPPDISAAPKGGAVQGAAITCITICGYIVLFQVIGAVVGAPLASIPGAGLVRVALQCILEMSSGCAALAALPIALEIKLPLLCAVMGFGGLCICAQNMAYARGMGISLKTYLWVKGLHALVATLCCRILMALPRASLSDLKAGLPAWLVCILLAAALYIPVRLLGRPRMNKKSTV